MTATKRIVVFVRDGDFMKEKRKYLWCFIPFIVSICIFVIVGMDKRITFCDEVYTYMIVNSSNGAYHLAEGTWYTQDEVVDMLGHTSDDSVVQMLRNVKADPHPPLYYGLVYIASLINGKNVSEWAGLSVNAIMYAATVVLIWMIIYRLFSRPVMASAAAIVCALNVGLMSDAMLIRMYMQFTFFTIAFAYATLRLYGEKDRILNYVLLGIITAGGFLTQYYFCFVAIAFFVVWAIYNIMQKSYSRIAKYIAAMAGAVIVDTIVWRFWISTLLSNNNSGAIKENALNFANIFNSMYKGMMTVQLVIFQKLYIVGGVAALLIVGATLASRRVSERYKDMKLYVGTLFIVVFFYASIVYYLTPSHLMSGRYFYAAAGLELLLLSVCVCTLVQAYLPEMVNSRTGTAVMCAIAILFVGLDIAVYISGYGIDYYTDAAEYDEQRELLEQYADIPWILCGEESWQMSAGFFDYMIPERLIRVTNKTQYRSEPELEAADKFLIIAQGDEENSDKDTGLYYYIGCTGGFAKSEFLMKRNEMVYYIAYPVQ